MQTRADRKKEKKQEKMSSQTAFDLFCKDAKPTVQEDEGISGIPVKRRSERLPAEEEADRAVGRAARRGETVLGGEALEAEAIEEQADADRVPAVHGGSLRGAAAGASR